MCKKVFCTALALILLCCLAGCGQKALSLDLSAITAGGDLLPGVKPLCSVDEVRAAGVKLQDDPLGTNTDPASGLISTTYGITPQDCTLSVGKYEAHNGQFVFLDEKLTEIHLNLKNKDDTSALKADLTDLYGEPVEVKGVMGTMLGWRLTGDCPVLIQLTALEDADGTHTGTQFAVGYMWFETKGQEP